MLREAMRNKLIISAYILGTITVILAIFLILMPYKVNQYYNGPAINKTFIVNPSDIIIITLETSKSSLHVNLTINKWIPETNITITLYYTENLGPNQLKTLNFTTLTSLNTVLTGQGQIEILGIRRSALANALTIILTILFILTISLLITGFIELITNISRKT
ncbi:MAG: hypothetical protein TU36_001350 [Vulcanisaeta sp. AZ3]